MPRDQSTSLVSVILPNYNQAKWILESLESIRNQTYRNIELILVDDCSTDNSVDTISSWIQRHQVRCAFIKHDVNQGLCRSLNDGLAVARGKFVAKIDADDVWLPEKTEQQVKILEAQPEDVAMVYSDALQISETGELLPQTFMQTRAHITTPPEGDIFAALWRGNFILNQASLIRRSCIDAVGWFDENLSYEDWDMFLRLAKKFKVVFSPSISLKYRIHALSMVRSKNEAMERSRALIRLKLLEQDHSLETPELIAWLGRQLYRMRHPKRHRYLWKGFVIQKSIKGFLVFLFSICGISYVWLGSVAQAVKRVGQPEKI